jgi:hypothetical protein
LDDRTIVAWTRAGPPTLAPFTDPPPSAGVARTAQRQDVWDEAGRLTPADAPHVTLTLDPPADAPALCRMWQVAEPLADSGDVHQRSWALPPLNARRWTLRITLNDRPPRPHPTQRIVPSPAYDIRRTGDEAVTLDITL